MRKVTVSAPGKLMLLGDHAVVYGKPCIVTAVNQRFFVTIEQVPGNTFHLIAPDVGVKEYRKPIKDIGTGVIAKEASFVEAAIAQFIKKYPIKTGITITTHSAFSNQFGFGSSAASTVCVLKGLSILCNKTLSNRSLFTLSYTAILSVQGVGSGFDVASSIYGGVIYYVGGGKTITKIPISRLPLIVGYTGKKASTPDIIRHVLKLKESMPQIVESLFTISSSVVKKARTALERGDLETFGRLMDINEGILACLGVESEVLSRLIYQARLSGALGAKLSGAGIGDCMISIANKSNIESVKRAIKKAGGTVIDIKANEPGVRVDTLTT